MLSSSRVQDALKEVKSAFGLKKVAKKQTKKRGGDVFKDDDEEEEEEAQRKKRKVDDNAAVDRYNHTMFYMFNTCACYLSISRYFIYTHYCNQFFTWIFIAAPHFKFSSSRSLLFLLSLTSFPPFAHSAHFPSPPSLFSARQIW